LSHLLHVNLIEEYKKRVLDRSFNKASLEYNQVVDYSPTWQSE